MAALVRIAMIAVCAGVSANLRRGPLATELISANVLPACRVCRVGLATGQRVLCDRINLSFV